MRRMLAQLDERGLAWRAGLEVEFHVLRLVEGSAAQDHIAMPGPPPKVAPLNHGYQYLTEQRYDSIEPLMEVLRSNLQELDLPLRSLEIEFGPSQLEITFGATRGMQPADLMLLFRSATKQIFARAGYLASFMCRPQLPHVASSGWHLHHSIESVDRRNLFPHPDGLSKLARSWLGGLLQHAAAAAAFSTPTINGYKRYMPNSMAPDHIVWAYDNRAAMVRVVGQPGDADTRLENRVGEPAANPISTWPHRLPQGWMASPQRLIPAPQPTRPIARMRLLCQRA
jgi:glutamine synthetase